MRVLDPRLATTGDGIFHTELCAGVKVYGRVEERKDRHTGRRVTICKPPDEHRRVDLPHLRIIDQDLWDRAKAKSLANMMGHPAPRKRPTPRPYLLSGLTSCGFCGSGYTARGTNRLAVVAIASAGQPTAATADVWAGRRSRRAF